MFTFVFPLGSGGGGGGTVTSVGLTMPSDYIINNSPIISGGDIAVTYANQLANKVFASPNGSTGIPSFRLLVGSDLPVATTITIGALSIAQNLEILNPTIFDKIITPGTFYYGFQNTTIGAITPINSAISNDNLNTAFAKAQGQLDAKQDILTIGNLTGSEFSITGGTGAVIGSGLSLSLATTGVTATTYGTATSVPVFTVDSKGRITGVTNTPISFPPSGVTSVFARTGAVIAQTGDYTFAQIGSTPTTVSGYGITDAVVINSASSIASATINGLAGSGYLSLAYQSIRPTGLASYTTVSAGATGNIVINKNQQGFDSTIALTATAARTYTLQDRNGIIVDDTDLALKADITYVDAQDALKEDLITKNATNTPLVWTSANGVASFQPLPVVGTLVYYFTNTASDVATYYKQTYSPQVALTSLPYASVTDGQLLSTFITEPNNPLRTSIPDGQYQNHLHLGKTGGTKTLQVRAEVWETTSAGVDIVKLADLGPSTIITGSGSTEYIIGYNTTEKTLASNTSRLATKLYAVISGSGSAPSISVFQGDGSDSRTNFPAPIIDATNYVPYTGALNDVDLGSRKITTSDIIVSNATASTIAHFDGTKNIESLPLATYPSLTEISYVKGVTSGVQTQIDSKIGAYIIPNYYKVNYTTGSNVTGVAGRTDKPFATLQYVWDLIPNNNTTDILIEIEDDYTFTTHAIYEPTLTKNNITFTFLNDIVYNVNSTTTSRPLFSFYGGGSNLTFNVPSFTMTKQGSFYYSLGVTNNNNFNFTNINALQGIITSVNFNTGFLQGASTGLFKCNNLNISLTNDSNNIKGFETFFNCTSMSYLINNVTITGSPTVSSSEFYLFYGLINSITIGKYLCSVTNYTNISGIAFSYNISCPIINIENIEVVSNSGLKVYPFFYFGGTGMILNVKKCSILNNQTLFNVGSTSEMNFGYLEYNGNGYYANGTELLGTLNFEHIKSINTIGSIGLTSNTRINGVGKGLWEYNDTTFVSTGNCLLIAFGTSNAQIKNVTFKATGMQTGNINSFVPIRFYQTGGKIRLDNVIFTSNLDTNNHANTTPVRAYAESGGYTCTLEGSFSTNYLKEVTGLTNNCEVDLISGFTS